jgi:hypothetical protein
MPTTAPASMDDIAQHWAHSINLLLPLGADTALGAQRALEIHLDAVPGTAGLRKAWRDRRAYAVRSLGISDPRAATRARGWWATWLARRGLAAGDRITGAQRVDLEADLRRHARPYVSSALGVGTYAWRRAGKQGSANHALALLLEEQADGSVALTVRPTRAREASRERRRVQCRLWYEDNRGAARRTHRRIAKARDEAIARLRKPADPA